MIPHTRSFIKIRFFFSYSNLHNCTQALKAAQYIWSPHKQTLVKLHCICAISNLGSEANFLNTPVWGRRLSTTAVSVHRKLSNTQHTCLASAKVISPPLSAPFSSSVVVATACCRLFSPLLWFRCFGCVKSDRGQIVSPQECTDRRKYH